MKSKHTSDANQRLIEAAPEMYEALGVMLAITHGDEELWAEHEMILKILKKIETPHE